MVNNNNEKIVNEEQLREVVGGADQIPGKSPKKCHFVHSGSGIEKNGDKYTAKCGTTWLVCQDSCACFGKNHCVRMWHEVTENGSALPRNDVHKHWYE